MRAVVGACLVSVLCVIQASASVAIGLACAVSAVLGRYLSGSFPIPNSDFTASCGLSMTSTSCCTAGYVSTAITILACLLIISMQCATVNMHQHGFWGPILSILGFIWWAAYGGAATSASHSGNHWDPTLTSYRTAVVALSWCICALFIPSLIVSAVSVAAAARAGLQLADPRGGPMVRFSQPPSPPVSPCKSSKSFGSAYEPFKETESPKKWIQPQNRHSNRFAVTSDGLRTLLVVAGQPVPLSPSPSLTHSPSVSPSRSPTARSPTARSPMHPSLGAGGAGTFTTVLLPGGSQDLSGHPGHG